MPNMAAVISQHNSSILRGGRTVGENYKGGRPCNCRVKEDCPPNGTCQVQLVVYKANITTTSEEREYTGLTALTFKQRYNEHQHNEGRHIPSQHVPVEPRLGPQRSMHRIQHLLERAEESQRLPKDHQKM